MDCSKHREQGKPFSPVVVSTLCEYAGPSSGTQAHDKPAQEAGSDDAQGQPPTKGDAALGLSTS